MNNKIIGINNIVKLENKLQNIPPQGRINSSIDNPKIHEMITMMQETGLSFIINERINSVGVDELDEIIDDFKNDFYKLTSYLKNNGFIDIHGYDIAKKTNI